jgi:hypothetical protein
MEDTYKRSTGLNYFTGLLKDGGDYYVLRSGIPVYEFNEIWIEMDDHLHTVFSKEKIDSMFIHAPNNEIAKELAEIHGVNNTKGMLDQNIPFEDDGKRIQLIKCEEKYNLIRELGVV